MSVTCPVRRIMLASEGRAFRVEAVQFAIALASRHEASIDVLSVARVWGSAFGFPHPGLLPSVRELDAHRDRVAAVLASFSQAGISGEGMVLSSRQPAKHIAQQAERRGCDTIVMSADRRRHWLVADFMWSQEPYRVRRRTALRVILIPEPAGDVPTMRTPASISETT